MKTWTHYITPSCLSDVLRALQEAPAPARVVAGGTDLLLELRQGSQPPLHTLVDVSAVPEMRGIELREGRLRIGAAEPISRIANSPLVHTHAQALSEAASLIGGPQVRNVATLGGNVAHALPAADGAIALAALDAVAEIASPAGVRRAPLTSLYRGVGQTALAGDEVLLGFSLPLRGPGEASAFRRVMRPQGVAVAILNVAVWLRREGERIAEARLSVGPSGPVVRRMTAAEDALRGQPLSEETIRRAHAAILQQASFRTSRHRATKAYRERMAGVLLRETLTSAYERAAA
ncbi:MAG: xanthine dehydrogenase family protein subunit M [Anaerolineales bacterium]